MEKAIQQLQHDHKDPDERRKLLTKEMRHLEAELAHLTAAIASGGSLSALLSAVQERETRRVKLQAELETLDGVLFAKFDGMVVEQELRGYLKDWAGLSSRHPAQTRQILRKLLSSRIRLSHDPDGAYRFMGEAAVGRMLKGLLGSSRGKLSGVPPYSQLEPYSQLAWGSQFNKAKSPHSGIRESNSSIPSRLPHFYLIPHDIGIR